MAGMIFSLHAAAVQKLFQNKGVFFCFYDFDEQFIFTRPSLLHQFILEE